MLVGAGDLTKEVAVTESSDPAKAAGTPGRRASDIMIRPVRTIKVSSTLIDAHNMMSGMGIHHLLVVDENETLVGVLSDRDIKKFASPFAGSKLEEKHDRATLKMPISGIMSKKVISCSPETTLKNCLEIMLQRSVHALPVVMPSGKLVGLVTATDLMKLLLNYL
jgi:acetoin utilization protein AcuB